MKLLLFYFCLLAVLLQAVSASTSSGGCATLTSKASKKAGHRKAKVGGKPVGKKAPGAAKKTKKTRNSGDSSVVVKKNRLASLSEILPKVLVKMVIGYLNDYAYPILVSTHDWLLEKCPEIRVDSARLYVMTNSEGLKGLNHSLANLKEDERPHIEFGDPQWADYWGLTSSHDGRYVSFNLEYQEAKSFGSGSKTKRSIKWLTQDSKPEDEEFKPVAFNSKGLPWGLLSQDGQTLVSYSMLTDATHVYRVKEEAEKDPVAVMKFELKGRPCAVSGKGNRVMLLNAGQLEIHDIGKDASRLFCQINSSDFLPHRKALNEDGSGAAFANINELRVMKVDSVAGDNIEQLTIATVKIPELSGIVQLAYSDENELHVLYRGGKVSLFDSLKNTLVPIEAPEERQEIIRSAISPNADYIAGIQYLGQKENKHVFRTTVKRKEFTTDDLRNVFGYESEVTSSRKQTERSSEEPQ